MDWKRLLLNSNLQDCSTWLCCQEMDGHRFEMKLWKNSLPTGCFWYFSTCVKAVSCGLSILWSTVRKVQGSILKWYLCKMHIVQKLKPKTCTNALILVPGFGRINNHNAWRWKFLWSGEPQLTYTNQWLFSK